jgi:hypothetical protein
MIGLGGPLGGTPVMIVGIAAIAAGRPSLGAWHLCT